MPENFIRVTHDDAIAVVTLNRPVVNNALDADMLQALRDKMLHLREDQSVRGILLTGEGKNFCAGADIAAMLSMTPPEAANFAAAGQQLMFAIEATGKPVIAAVRGYALGGGLELALACDFILASQTAIFAAPEIRLGIIPGFGCTQRLPRLVGKSRAKELIFTGDRVTAQEACDIGLVNRVFSDEDLLPQAVEMLKKICSRGSLSLRLAKEVIDAGSDVDLRNGCLMERDVFALCFSTEDQKEGMTAFMEKRAASFKGK